MSISSLTCSPPVRRATRTPQLDYELFDQAVALFEEGKPRDAMFRVFRHLLPGHPVTEAPVGSFTLPQGSSNVTVRWDDVELWVSVPMVRLPAGGGTAALRFLLSKMSGTGQLHQPRLRGDDVSLEFHDRLAHLHPLKLLEVLRSMPVVADNNDDWMVDQFGVTLLERGSVVPLDDDEFARAEAIWHSHWSEVEVLFKEAQRKRNLFFLNEVTSYAVYHLRAALPLGGHLGARLWEAAATFNESNESPAKREAALTKCIKGMKAVAADDLRRNLGHAHYGISPLSDGTPGVLTQHLGSGDYVDTVERARASGNLMDAAVALFSTYNFLLARFAWPEAIETGLRDGLAQASQKPWREAVSVLGSQGKRLAASFGEETEGDGAEQDGAGEGDPAAAMAGDEHGAARGES